MANLVSPSTLVKNSLQSVRVWANQRGPAWVLQPSYSQIAAAVGVSSGAVLQVGCGAGWLALYLGSGKPDLDVVGIDTDRAALDIGDRNKGTRLNVTLRQMAPEQIVYPEATFHAAVAVGDSRRWQDTGAVLTEVFRVLRPGARFYVYEGDAELSALPPGWLRSPGPWLPERALLAAFRREALGAADWETLKGQVRQSPFGGGEDGRHGPYRRLVLTRP